MNNALSLRGLLLDWDGTTVDSYQPMLSSLRYAYQKHLGIFFPKDEEEFRLISPMRLTESTTRYAGEHADEVAESYLWYYEHEGYKLGRVFPHMREVLTELYRHGIALGVVTNTNRHRLNIDLDYLQLTALFDVIMTSEDTPERKPHPAPLLKGAERLGMDPHDLAYIGDYPGDMIAARDAGMLAIAALWGGIFPAASVLAEQPDYCLQTPQELLAL